MIQKKSLRIWVYLILFAGIVFCFSFWLAFQISLDSAHEVSLTQTKKDLQTFAKSVAVIVSDKYRSITESAVDGHFDASSLDRMLKDAAGFTPDFRISLIDKNGSVVADSDSDDVAVMENHKYRTEVFEALRGSEGSDLRHSTVSKNEVLYYACPLELGGEIYALRLSMPLYMNVLSSSGIQRKMALVFLILLFVALGFSFLISARLIRQVVELQRAAGEYASGNFSYRSNVTSPKELVALSVSLEQMASQIQENIESIARSRDDFQAVFSGITEGLIVFDSNMVILAYNESAEKFFAVSINDAVGSPLIQVVRNADIMSLINKTVSDSSCPPDDISVQLFQSAQVYDLLVRCVPIKNYSESGQPRRFLLIVTDTTRLRRLEQVRKDFVANVSHELKTPVTAIKGFAETLLENPSEDIGEQRKFLEIINSQTERLGDIIDDLLTLSKLDQETKPPEVMPVDIASVLKTISSGFVKAAESKGITLSFASEDNLPPVDINQALFQHAISNLLDNAVKYCSSGMTVTCSVSADTSGLLGGDRGVCIVVEDSGSGIPDNFKERIFERFFRVDKGRSRDQGGTGLGLSIARHVINVHGGIIRAVDRPDGKSGARFEIFLPASKNADVGGQV